MTTALQQSTDSTTTKDDGSFLLLPSLIGFLFAFRTCLTVLWFQDDPQVGSTVSVAISLILLTIAALATIGSTPSIPAACFRTPVLRWIAVFLGLNLLSLLWTEAPLIGAASYLAATIANVAIIWFILRDGDAASHANAVLRGYVWGTCLVAITAWLLPALPDLRLGNEVFLHPNSIGFICATATLMAIYLTHWNKSFWWPALWLALTLIRTISKTSIIAFFAAMIFYLFKNKILARSTKIWIGIAGGLILVSLSSLLIAYFDAYTETTGPETLTGRTVIWAAAAAIAVEKPILGHGFYSLRFLIPPIGTFEPQHAHNEFLQQFFVLGAVGVLVALSLYWVAFRQIRRAPASRLKTLAATLLIYALIRGLADTENFDLSYPLWLMAMLSILLASLSPSSLQPPQQNHLNS